MAGIGWAAVPLWNLSSIGGTMCRTLFRMPLVVTDISGPLSAGTMAENDCVDEPWMKSLGERM